MAHGEHAENGEIGTSKRNMMHLEIAFSSGIPYCHDGKKVSLFYSMNQPRT